MQTPVVPTRSARSRTARRNGSIRRGAAVGDSGVPPGAGTTPTAVSQNRRMTPSCKAFILGFIPEPVGCQIRRASTLLESCAACLTIALRRENTPTGESL